MAEKQRLSGKLATANSAESCAGEWYSVMEQADRLIMRIEEARNALEEEVRKAKHLSPTLHHACIEAGVVLDDALAVLVHFRQICDEFIRVEPSDQLKLKY